MHLFWSLLYYFWQVIDKILPLLVLIVAICAIYVAIQSKREAKVAAQMNIFYQLLARYSSSEMHEALGIIGELFDTRRQDEAAFFEVVKKYHDKERSLSAWMIDVEADTPSGLSELFRHRYQETNQSRRQVSNFFTYSFELFTDFKVLDDVYFKKICSIDTFKFLYYVIEWLELALNPDYNRKTFTELLEQSGREDIEDLKRLRPPGTWTLIEQMIEPRRGR